MITTSRRRFVSFAALASAIASTGAKAQFGGHSRMGGGSSRASHSDDGASRRSSPPAVEAMVAIERELPSLRIDLKLTAEQATLFDGYERQVRLAADAERLRARHTAAFRVDDGSAVKASVVLTTIADDDAERADAARAADERMQALYAALTADQQRQFDARTIQSLRDPLGTS